jgi:hypothetical protein
MLVAHLLAPTGQRYSVHKNECNDNVYFVAQYIVTSTIAEVIKYSFYISLHIITVTIMNNVQYFQCLQVFWLCMIYISCTP